MSIETKKKLVFEDDSSLKDFNAVLTCAIRYSIGRRTYMPSLVTNFIISNCKDLLDNISIDSMIREIEECTNYGDPCDEETWDNFLIFLKLLKENRGKGE